MKQLIIIAVFFFASLAVNANGYEKKIFPLKYYLSTFNKNTDNENNLLRIKEKKCTKAGLMCKDCRTLVNCIQINNEWREYVIATCEKPFTCSVDKCTDTPNPECSESSFVCQNTGIYPDPLNNCHIYHMCVKKNDASPPLENDQVTTVYCDDFNFGYNPITTYCDKKLINGACPTNPAVPQCRTVGQSGAITGTSIFYICIKNGNNPLVPNLFMCPYGSIFEDGMCL